MGLDNHIFTELAHFKELLFDALMRFPDARASVNAAIAKMRQALESSQGMLARVRRVAIGLGWPLIFQN
ncbi:MAG: hypothetical protein U0Q16_04325 [Bryobacteraceae bacterium]